MAAELDQIARAAHRGGVLREARKKDSLIRRPLTHRKVEELPPKQRRRSGVDDAADFGREVSRRCEKQ
jgi:hypothetical protein